MYTLITVLIFITCVLLILIVLVQNSKGGGLASNFQSSNQIMGVRKTTDFLEKATWVLAAALLFFSVLGSAFIPRSAEQINQSAIKDQIENAVDPTAVPNFPTTTPQTDDSAEETPAE
ncbi:preprotein translocase subunit SecG [Sunxiuqinia elliptica]|jgi:preprotein translocase subunit SecG|uniref:Protein-export membrane protein SecG n=1 Tax=Sunxiuqinia elliptica TaxID=655355 RepID=A0A4R6H5U7_9BACT|nr:preprotein translocase subunit SecG [Sunxiuqinia elliptica]TDO03324.1 protein translocase subunit secG [Sunxiuqinia elliptica]TDO59521.1 protein translocase subunit secG [Sunxiuqinia elliptica]